MASIVIEGSHGNFWNSKPRGLPDFTMIRRQQNAKVPAASGNSGLKMANGQLPAQVDLVRTYAKGAGTGMPSTINLVKKFVLSF